MKIKVEHSGEVVKIFKDMTSELYKLEMGDNIIFLGASLPYVKEKAEILKQNIDEVMNILTKIESRKSGDKRNGT